MKRWLFRKHTSTHPHANTHTHSTRRGNTSDWQARIFPPIITIIIIIRESVSLGRIIYLTSSSSSSLPLSRRRCAIIPPPKCTTTTNQPTSALINQVPREPCPTHPPIAHLTCPPSPSPSTSPLNPPVAGRSTRARGGTNSNNRRTSELRSGKKRYTSAAQRSPPGGSSIRRDSPFLDQLYIFSSLVFFFFFLRRHGERGREDICLDIVFTSFFFHFFLYMRTESERVHTRF
jgi:hypothetical protein